MSGAEDFASGRKENEDKLSAQLRKQAVAKSVGFQYAAVAVVVWFLWVCLRAANSSPD
jgi:hypothetical protein